MGGNETKHIRNFGNSLLLSLSLSAIGGFLDAYTYLLKGGVFANAQTGNLVLLALSLAKTGKDGLMKYLLPIAAFVVGVICAELIRSSRVFQLNQRWVLATLGVETTFLVLLSFFSEIAADWVVTSLISLVAALQASSFKSAGTLPFATTMITGNLRSSIELIVQALRQRKTAKISQGLFYLAIIGTFALGAFAGGGLATSLGSRCLFVGAGSLAVVTVVASVRRRKL